MRRKYTRQFTWIAGLMFVEARCPMVVKPTQMADQLVSNLDVRTTEVSKTLPDAVSPFEHRKG